MAFVKVVRRSMRPEEWTDLRYGWIKRGIIDQKYELTDLLIRDAHQTGENEYHYDNDYHPLKKGDLCFTPDGTVFIKGSGTVPAALRGKKVWFLLHTAAEMIVKINGRYAGGIDPNRDRILLNPWISGTGCSADSDVSGGTSAADRPDLSFTFEIEAFNRSKPDDERNPDAMQSRGCRQIFDGAYLCTVRESLLSLYYDLTLLLDIAGSDSFDEDYRRFLNRELDQALNLMDFDDLSGADAALSYIEEHIYRNTDFRSSGNVALVGHSHLDIAYYWRRMHVVQKNARTVLIQMRLMDRYPDFHYAHTQPYTYELLKKYYPDLFAELREKIRNGQFEPIGAMYVEPDCNIPCAESLIRQCLYGQQFYRREFGITVDNAWLPDVFGNSWILPQILRKSGVRYFVSNKMSTWNDTNRFPHNSFLWKGIDGSRVYACVPPTHFITWNMPSQIKENWDAYQDKETGGQTLSMFGYGDGGSGATEEMIELMHRFDKLSIMPRTEHMRADTFLHNNLEGNTDLATWDGELYLEMHRGTFTSKSILKAMNRRLEFKIRTAELLSVLRILKGVSYPADRLRDCYKRLLLNQFHDILPGSHIHPVFMDAMKDYNEIEKELDEIISGTPAGSGQLLPDTAHPLWFNPLNFTRRNITFIPDEKGPVCREGQAGFYALPEIPALSASEVPMPDAAAAGAGSKDWLQVSAPLHVETPYYRIDFLPDGSMSGLQDAATGREWTDGGFNKLHLYQDVPGMYDAWDILPNYKDVEYPLTVKEPLHVSHTDASVAELTAVLETPEAKSRLTMIIRLFRHSPYIEVEHITDWNEKHRLLKAEFSCNVLSRELVCDTSAGCIRRETHRNTTWQQARFEVCHHKWCDFSEEDGGIALINEGKYGLGVEEKGMSLSLLRSNIRPDVMSDIGHHDFSYVILPHAGSHIQADINRKALEYNVPPVKIGSDTAAAAAAQHWDFGALYLEAAKLSEDGQSAVFRLSEQDGRRGTLRLPAHAVLMNMLEDAEGTAGEITYHPFEIITFAVPLQYLQ